MRDSTWTDAERARYHAWLDALLTGDVQDREARTERAATYEAIDRDSARATVVAIRIGLPGFAPPPRSRAKVLS